MNTGNNATIIDVRTPGEFAEQHVAGAINIPLDQFTKRLTEIRDMPKPIVAYCRSGGRSGMAVSMMKQFGITDVANGGGIAEMLSTTQ